MTRLSVYACAIAVLVSPAAAGALHDAVKAGDIAQVTLLISQGEDVNKRERPIGAPLHYAATWGTAEMAELLLSKGADVNGKSNLGTPLKLAALKGNDAVALVLIAHGADIQATSGDGTTPLHAAAQGGYVSMVELLIEKGADVNVRSTDRSGINFAPVHSAGRSSHFDIVDLLRAYGAKGPRVGPIANLLSSADLSEGEKVFRGACGECHSIEQGSPRAGPSLWGVLERKKASLEDYKYSQAFNRLVGVWTLAEINAFIAAPTDYAPGTTMHIKGVEDPAQRANLIAFLRQHGDEPPPLPQRP